MMANEVIVAGSLQYTDANSATDSLQIAPLTFSVATVGMLHLTQSIPTAGAAINLGGLGTLGQVMIVNRDTTNYVDIYTASGGTKFAKLLAGRFLILPISSNLTAPYAQANTAAVIIEYMMTNI